VCLPPTTRDLQFTYKALRIAGASVACVQAPGLGWTQVFAGLDASGCPVAFDWRASPGNLVLLDSTLGPGVGSSAIVLGGGNGALLQNVTVNSGSGANATAWVVQGLLPTSGSQTTLVPLWRAGPAWQDGAVAAPVAAGPLLLPSSAGAAHAGLPLACGGLLCGGSAENPGTGIPANTSRDEFVRGHFDNAVTDFGAVGDG
jgi:hypothetical protein